MIHSVIINIFINLRASRSGRRRFCIDRATLFGSVENILKMVVRLIKVKFCMVHIVICYTFIGQSSSEEWTNTSETTMVKLSNVTGVVHTDTDVNMPKGRSISTCMHHCTERNYASFVFFEDSKTCLCSSEQADPGNVAEQYTGVIYGERKVRVFTSYLQVLFLITCRFSYP